MIVEYTWTDIKIPVDQDEAGLPHLLARKLKIPPEAIANFRIIRRSIDARKKPAIYYVYTVGFALNVQPHQLRRVLARCPQIKERPPLHAYAPYTPGPDRQKAGRPLVVGAGPAGYFAALMLAQHGYRPLLLERGDKVEDRSQRVEHFWQSGSLDPESNVQFGEGGAGTFSDGKLTTRIDDPRIRFVLETFVEHGAASEILYSAKPHIGTDVLKAVVTSMRRRIEALGGEIRFRSCVTNLKIVNNAVQAVEINHSDRIAAGAVILAAGHSARDVYRFLKDLGVALEPKPFAMGLRIEHAQALINQAQYGVLDHPVLGPADYQLTYNDKATGRGAYSFCMCPGGLVVASSSEEGGVATNGMSYFARNSGVANSALVVTVRPADFGSDDPLAGVGFQRAWERKAFEAGGSHYRVPAQTAADFLKRKTSDQFTVQTTYRPGYTPAELHAILPPALGEVLERALLDFDRKIPGFAGAQATLTGIESRTSAPVRILRDQTGQALRTGGLFPAGEGAGYAGGITSSAVDGIKAAEKLMTLYAPTD